ncbi:MAG: phosphoribosyl-ATP diphosphatase [Paludibacteraceae bacterium]|nr:phosphoribosyl-ATP diphosphatase [Paludibacteraceae bacterium]MBR2261144.1 phosphoribosyl-ATP diphosphatase [Paludibacteraceae bacterium]MEE3483750.1 phosphoribosyl-ATP diphosphatase [Bacteroidales bacterium]
MDKKIQAVVQDIRTEKILRIGYVNETALAKMEETKEVYLLGDNDTLEAITGGEYFKPIGVDSILYNTDKSAVIIKALPEGSTTGADTFRGDKNLKDLAFLSYLQDFIEKRKREMPEGSYTTKLFTKGLNKISQKVGEEAVETIIEATNGTGEQFLYESSDLIYHLIVLLTEKGYRIEDLARELKARHKE